MAHERRLMPGDPAPWVQGASVGGRSDYGIATAAGRPMLLLLFESAERGAVRAALRELEARRSLFDDVSACFFGVSCDPSDVTEGRIGKRIPGIRFFLDPERRMSAALGACDTEAQSYDAHWLLLDPALQVMAAFDLGDGARAVEALARLVGAPASETSAPVLRLSGVFEPALCRHLVDLYRRNGGTPSGFMDQVDGRTVVASNREFKRRRDWLVEDQGLRQLIVQRIRTRLVPRVKLAFQFEATRIERYLVACYEGADQGRFAAHRDNTTGGTAHRRFAVTINLNDDFDGGELRFPEFGPRTYRAPAGGAVVFSCSLLHEATPVTRGERFAFLPFLYDEAAARQREANNALLGEGVARYGGTEAAKG